MKADFKYNTKSPRNPNWRLRRTALKRCHTLESVFACIVVIGLVNGLSGCKIFKPNVNSKFLHSIIYSEAETVKANKIIKICSSKNCTDTASAILSKMNTEIKPCDDFYQFACGNYINKTEIPDDKGRVNSFSEVSKVLQRHLKDILEEEISKTDPKYLRLPNDLYKGCMNTNLTERLGPKPIQVIAKGLGGWPVIVGDGWNSDNSWTWQETVKQFGRLGFSINYIFDFFVEVNIKNSTQHIIILDQSSTKLDRIYLNMGLNNSLVKDYFKYMVDMAVLFGADLETAKQELEKSLQFEMDLAKISRPMEEDSDFSVLYNLRSIKQLQELYPYVNWSDYFNAFLPEGSKVDEDEMIILSVPSFFDDLGKLLNSTNIRVIANYLMFRIHDDSADFLSEKFRKRKLKYTTNSTVEQEKGPKCAQTVLKSLQIAVGSLYVRKHFREETRPIVLEMFENIRNAFDKLLDKARWMDNKTKRKAKNKLLSMTALVGYRDEMLDNNHLEKYYRNLGNVDPDKYFESVLRLKVFENNNLYSKLKLQVNKTDWVLNADPALADAYYTPTENSIIIPAGILQGNFFKSDRPKFMNYGAIGSLIGHELTHGFDVKGRQFDADGNFVDWWQNATEEVYLEKAQCIIDQYGNYKDKQTGLNLNGNNTLCENIADYGGYKEAYLAYTRWLAKNSDEPKLLGLENYSSRQMFWISAAQMWCAKHTKEDLQDYIKINTHSPEEFRVLGPLQNLNDFSRDFQCTSNTLMNPVKKCELW